MKGSTGLIIVALGATLLLTYGLVLPLPPAPGAPAAVLAPSTSPTCARLRGRGLGAAGLPREAAGRPELPTPPPTATPTPTPPPTATPLPAVTPTPTFVAPCQVRGRALRVFIDPGHGGPDAGAVHVGPGGEVDLLEKDVDLDISLRLAALLEAAGHEVLLARSEDRGLTPAQTGRQELYARVDMANEAGADLFISVHNNGHSDRSQRGTEVYYCSARPYSDENKRLAIAVQAALVEALRRAGYETVDRAIHDDIEVYRGHMGVLGPRISRPTRMVAVLGESLFVTNDADAAQLARPEIRQAIAEGYAEGIRAYLEAVPFK